MKNLILIIEDDPDVQECYLDFLVPKGFRIITASNGEEGLKKIVQYNPNLIILDLSMPHMDGRTMLSHLKKINKDIPILIVSAREGMKNDPEIQMSRQVYGFLCKPVAPQILLRTIEEKLKKEAQTKKIERIAGYILREYLGGGGSGKVFKAVKADQEVAIKMLSPDFFNDDEEVARFHREALMLANLNHPNIVKLIDSGKTKQGFFYIIMEYFPGKNLEAILEEERKLTIKESCDILKQVATGITPAHKKGLVHRDLKPGNILYDRKNNLAKVIDFGTMRKIKVTHPITKGEYVIGTVYYMAPECCQGKKVDHRADIYSLGATFFRMITGEVAFDGESDMQVMYSHVTEPLKWPYKVILKIPPVIKKMVEKMMAKSPKNRYKNMEEVIAKIEEVTY